jgi:photosystem II stability/assembly factor-like uncharacterized protein
VVRHRTGVVVAGSLVLLCLGAVPATAATNRSGNPWPVRLSEPGRTTFNAVSCATTLVCTATGIGVSGFTSIFGTVDGGTTWARETDPVPVADVERLTCPTPTFCMAEVDPEQSAPAVEFMTTTDGGATWAVRSELASLAAVELLACVSDTTCYAWDAGSLVVTRDGGSTWSDGASMGFTYGASCPTTTTCYFASLNQTSQSVVDETTDGGATVRAVVTTDGYDALSCPSAGSCAVASVGQFLETDDDGATWTIRAAPPLTRSVDALVCSSLATCTASGAAGGSQVATTTDAGASWATTTLSPAVGASSPSSEPPLACPAASSCFLVGGFIATNTIDEEVGGAWIPRTATTGLSPIEAVACPTPETCVGVGPGIAERSTDRGVAWTRVATSPGPGDTVSAVDCPTATRCLAVGAGPSGRRADAYVSTDAGRSWRELPLEDVWPPMTDLACASAATCLVTTSGAAPVTLLRSIDGGQSWRPVALPAVLARLDTVSCVSSLVCRAGGAVPGGEGQVLVSTSAGRHWSVRSNLPRPVLALSCVTAADCGALVAANYGSSTVDNAFFEESRDFGRTWTGSTNSEPYGPGSALSCDRAACAQVVSFADAGPTVSWLEVTVDGGGTWSTYTPADASSLRGLARLPGRSAWIAGGSNDTSGPFILSSP